MTRVPNFAFLEKLSPDELIGTIYYAVRLIKEVNAMKDIELGYSVEGGAGEPGNDVRKLSQAIVREIARVEGMPLRNIKNEIIEKHIKALARILQARLNKDQPNAATLGKQLLDEMRKQD